MPEWYLKATDGSVDPIALPDSPVSIGRHPQNTVRIDNDRASRFHCVIEPDGRGGYIARDLQSRNGIKVNTVKVDQSLLREGDVLRVAGIDFVIEGAGSVIVTTTSPDTEDISITSAWAQPILAAIDAVPGRKIGIEAVILIDASGKPSEALAGAGDGAKAAVLLLQAASATRATDIHVEPKAEAAQLRMRVDGEMVAIAELPRKVNDLIQGLVKAACQMKASARDAMLDGHFGARIAGRRVDYRVSFTPSVYGQKLVVRVLDPRAAPESLSAMGLPPYMLDPVKRVCQQDHGMLLACGPTGSGKTTTLYNALREIDRAARNVVTIEDPVEYQLDGTTQIPIDEFKGNGFGSLLRSVLRQDPDVILVGEIRDEETARTAMQAAMTGHLVFSSTHAKDTIAAIFRLLDLKVEPYLVANSLNLVLSQRLVRVLCEHCRREIPVTPGQASRLGRYLLGKSRVYTGTGCARCLRTGFRGRRAIFELLEFNDELRDIVLREPTISAIRRVIESGIFTSLAQSGWRLVAEGVTSLEEVEQVTGTG